MDKTDIQKISADKELMEALGTVTLTWSLLNATIQATVWRFLNLDSTRGKILTANLSTGQLIQLLETVFDFLSKSFTKDEKQLHNRFFSGLNELNAMRNDIMHGDWEPILHDGKLMGMKALRSMARGELKTRERDWNVERLTAFSGHIKETSEMLVTILEELESQISAAESSSISDESVKPQK